MKYKVTVIVPIYNVSQFIERCVRSLFEQTLQEIEYIFVNDCTPDNSVEILEHVLKDYPKRKSQVCIVNHEQNQGLACSRIDGIRLATGKYIAHCDSDDWVDTNLYEKLYNKAEESGADITICDFQCEYTSGRESEKFVTNLHRTPRKALENMHNESFYCMVWRALWKRDFILVNNLLPLPHVDMWEDVCVTLPALYYANKVSKVDDSFCHYFVNDRSMCANSAKPKLYEDRKATINHLEHFFSDKEDIDTKILINYWKMLAKSFMLTTMDFNPKRWQKEYKEAHPYILRMKAIPPVTRCMYKVTSISALPIRLAMWSKKSK